MSCHHEDEDRVFGKAVECPRCRGTDIVLAAIWHRFKPQGERRAKAPELTRAAMGSQ